MSLIRPPPLSVSGILTIIETYFPLITVQKESCKEFDGYDDRNYYFRGNHFRKSTCATSTFQKVYITSPNEYVLKVVNSRDAAASEGWCALLKYLSASGFNCPQPIPSIFKQDVVPINKFTYLTLRSEVVSTTNELLTKDHYSLVLLTYIPGEMLNSIADKASLQFKFGHYLGSMDKELQVC